jgi:hypothetical protein
MTRLGTILRRTCTAIKDTDRFTLTPAGEAGLDAILDTSAAVQSVRQAYDGPASGQPKPEWILGVCPSCGGPVVSNSYCVGGRGYMTVWECWNGLSESRTCSYRKCL